MQRLRLSFVRTVFEAVHSARYHGGTLLRMLLPVVVITAASSAYFNRVIADGEYQSGDVGILIVGVLAWLYVATCMTLGLYRLFLFDRAQEPAEGAAASPENVYAWTNTHWRLLGWGVLLGILTLLTSIIPLVIARYISETLGATETSSTAQLLSAAAMLVGYYFYGRWVLALPMILLPDTGPSLGRSWDWSEGNSVHMLLCVGLLPTFQAICWAFVPETAGIGASLVGAVITTVVMAAEVIMVSRSLVRLQEAGVTAEVPTAPEE
ncbi:hypothetical protein [Marinimicrobium agarilyticum]|uniref:hypothetical protein n=1 Tax=Marinimicrobium agarilyticum TaxID=306546 RepID=UPI00040AAA2A|nr:hypothetical protein [Marinimicrobium agarilyticum]